MGSKDEVKKDKLNPEKVLPSKLDSNLQDFIKLIFNSDLMESAVAKNGYDVKKLPLGELSKETIEQGYKILSEIEKIINKEQKGNLQDLSSQFYTFIPHNFGRANMSEFVLNTELKLKDKQELIQKLVGINIANDIVNRNKKGGNL